MLLVCWFLIFGLFYGPSVGWVGIDNKVNIDRRQCYGPEINAAVGKSTGEIKEWEY